jgi:hypothetical protein
MRTGMSIDHKKAVFPEEIAFALAIKGQRGQNTSLPRLAIGRQEVGPRVFCVGRERASPSGSPVNAFGTCARHASPRTIFVE